MIQEWPDTHPNIVKCLAIHDDRIILERLQGHLYSYLSSTSPEGNKNEERGLWAVEAASGLHYLHSKRILKSDISTYNILLDKNRHPKWIDFAGSSLHGKEGIAFYGTWTNSLALERRTVAEEPLNEIIYQEPPGKSI